MRSKNFTWLPWSVSTIFQKLWRWREIPEDWKKVDVTPIYEKGLNDDAGNYRPITLILIPRKVMELTFLGAATAQLTKGKSCLTSLTAFYHKVTSPVDVRQAVHYLNFTKAFYTICLLQENSTCDGPDKGSVG